MSDQQTYGIGAVARLTGLTDHTIRVWERRYEAIVAQRASNGRRVYTAEDVEKLGLLKALTDRGVSIGRIANETIDALKERFASMAELAATPTPEEIRVAVLGDYLPSKIKNYDSETAPLRFVIVDTNADSFAADLGQQDIDVVVYEAAVLDAGAPKILRSYLRTSGARKAVFVFGFGSSHDVERLRDSGVVPLRGSAGVEELRAAVLKAYEAPSKLRVSAAPVASEAGSADWLVDGVPAPRLFTREQLSALANADSSIDCECPQQLSQLVADLSAFEIYSANCANRNEDDAALHRYLHGTTAHARSLIEEALDRVVRSEGLKI
jgi:DNA-binding transcriptional MerR regulator